eukprot:scaffold94224_cov10-Tisochrysis_lutea.AAC.1
MQQNKHHLQPVRKGGGSNGGSGGEGIAVLCKGKQAMVCLLRALKCGKTVLLELPRETYRTHVEERARVEEAGLAEARTAMEEGKVKDSLSGECT